MHFCQVSDIQARNLHRPTYSATSKPTITQIKRWIREVSAKLTAIINEAGYDVDNIHSIGRTVSSTVSNESYEYYPNTYEIDIHLSDFATGDFAVGDQVYIGNSDNSTRFEFAEVASLLVDGIKITGAQYDSYPSGSVVYKLNTSLEILRKAASAFVASIVENSSINPNQDRVDELQAEYDDEIEKIQGVEGYLYGATTNNNTLSPETATSYQVENPTDDYVADGPTFTMSGELW